MDTEFLVQMRQSNKCESVRKDEIFNLHLGLQNLVGKTPFWPLKWLFWNYLIFSFPILNNKDCNRWYRMCWKQFTLVFISRIFSVIVKENLFLSPKLVDSAFSNWFLPFLLKFCNFHHIFFINWNFTSLSLIVYKQVPVVMVTLKIVFG